MGIFILSVYYHEDAVFCSGLGGFNAEEAELGHPPLVGIDNHLVRSSEHWSISSLGDRIALLPAQ